MKRYQKTQITPWPAITDLMTAIVVIAVLSDVIGYSHLEDDSRGLYDRLKHILNEFDSTLEGSGISVTILHDEGILRFSDDTINFKSGEVEPVEEQINNVELLARAFAKAVPCYISANYTTMDESRHEDNTGIENWYILAADQGDVPSQFQLGNIYLNGWGVPDDLDKAIDWFRLAADQGDSLAQGVMGRIFLHGLADVPQDYSEAIKWLRLAGNQVSVESQFLLGEVYADGLGVRQDYGRAIKWYRDGANQGHTESQFRLYLMYSSGNGARKNDKKAVKSLELAANNGHAKAQYQLGLMYAGGNGVGQSDVQAYAWIDRSAAQGNETAVQARNQLSSKMTSAQIAIGRKLSSEIRNRIKSTRSMR